MYQGTDPPQRQHGVPQHGIQIPLCVTKWLYSLTVKQLADFGNGIFTPVPEVSVTKYYSADI
jgi:hypothetical protein